jgi:hypothetical protein
MPVPERDLGEAICDRLHRAATPRPEHGQRPDLSSEALSLTRWNGGG